MPALVALCSVLGSLCEIRMLSWLGQKAGVGGGPAGSLQPPVLGIVLSCLEPKEAEVCAMSWAPGSQRSHTGVPV